MALSIKWTSSLAGDVSGRLALLLLEQTCAARTWKLFAKLAKKLKKEIAVLRYI